MSSIESIEEVKQQPNPLFNDGENTSTTPLANTHSIHKKIRKERRLTPARTPQLVSLRQAYSHPWGTNIPPHRQAVLQASSPSPSPSPPSPSPFSSFSSAFNLSHLKSLARLSTSNLAIQPAQKHQDVRGVGSGPELIAIPNLARPFSVTDVNRHDSRLCDIVRQNENLKSLLLTNISKPPRDTLVASNQSPEYNLKYPSSPSPAKSITTQPVAQMASLVSPPSFQSIIRTDLLPSLQRAHSSPRCSFSLESAGSPQLSSETSSSPHSTHEQLQDTDKSLTPPCSPPTGTSSPSNCQTCRFPLSRASSESSFLLSLSYRSPLFDDFDEEDAAAHSHDPINHEASFSDEQDQVSRQPSLCSSSPDSPHPLSTWWSDLPPHRRAHIIEAESWPIFTPSAPVPILGSPLSGYCACSSLPAPEPSTSALSSPEQTKHTPDSSLPNSTLSSGSRPSFSTNLNLLVPAPLDQDEIDPLLSGHRSTLEIDTSSFSTPSLPSIADCRADACDSEPNSQPIRRKKRRGEESTPNSTESLLTKSLRRLSRKLPNIQWGNLSVRMYNPQQLAGSRTGRDGADGVDEEGPGEEENVLPSGVVDEDSSADPVGEDEKAQISRLVKSWTSDNIQPQNSLNGSFIVDPEMEWSSMMVQLETFSPNSNKKAHQLRTQTERKMPRRTRAEQHSRRPPGGNSDSTPTSRMAGDRRGSVEGEGDRSEPVVQEDRSMKRSQSKKRLTRSQQQKQQQQRGVKSGSDQAQKKNMVKLTRRVVSNPLHLLQLTLELNMMRNYKIKSPLKQRSMKLILTKLSPNSQANNEFEYISSPLRFEI
ncbi:hypothetical protein MJO29_004017 [Puccinia striiformis f. sp. tritici]|nr:hypothetical protein MJO29_004017 [Puccinia striiformis f. sp. tritici]